jgi:hypothetical protein
LTIQLQHLEIGDGGDRGRSGLTVDQRKLTHHIARPKTGNLVTEEARHISFARQYLKRTVPRLGFVRRTILGVSAPFLFGIMSRLMCFPPSNLVRTYGVPRSQLRRQLRSEAGRQLLRDSVAKPRKLCAELGLVNPVERWAWRLMGIWDEEAVPDPNPQDGRGPRVGLRTRGPENNPDGEQTSGVIPAG